MTRNGVEYDLNKSYYRVEKDGYTFVFSSRFNKTRFECRADDAKAKYAQKIFKTTGVKPTELFPALNKLYTDIEKRGYKVFETGVK